MKKATDKTYFMQICNDIGALQNRLRNISDRDSFRIEDGRVAIAQRDERTGRMEENLSFYGGIDGLFDQEKNEPGFFYVSGGGFGMHFQTTGEWRMDQEKGKSPRYTETYLAAPMAPESKWGKGTEVRLYMNKPRD
jgi:hypothetical protein